MRGFPYIVYFGKTNHKPRRRLKNVIVNERIIAEKLVYNSLYAVLMCESNLRELLENFPSDFPLDFNTIMRIIQRLYT